MAECRTIWSFQTMRKLLLLLTFCMDLNAIADDCVRIRGAFDVGSGSTKVKVARVDFCKQKILDVFYEDSIALSYIDDVNLYSKTKNELSPEIQNQGILIFNKLKKDAEAMLIKKGISQKDILNVKYEGVATEAFRLATKNSNHYMSKIFNELSIKIRVISQHEEAAMGFLGAATYASYSRHKIIVWDIGGGSMQITALKGEKESDKSAQGWIFYSGKVASKTFKNLYLEKIKRTDLKTPNPMGEKNSQVALDLAKELAKAELTPEIKNRMKHKDVEILGIGGVFTGSLKEVFIQDPKTLENFVTQDGLKKEIELQRNYTDQQFPNIKYADTEVTNMLLVLGFMKEANVGKIKVVPVNLADAVLLGFDPEVD